MKVVTSSRRQIVMAVLLGVAATGGAIRHWAANPSLLHDIGTLMLVLWLPAVGNLVGFVIQRFARREGAARDFAPHSPFRPHLRAVFTPSLPPGAAPVRQSVERCTLVLGQEGFTVRLAMPHRDLLATGQEQTVELELLRPALALPRLVPGTSFALRVDAALVGHGRVLGNAPASPTGSLSSSLGLVGSPVAQSKYHDDAQGR
jgi:hypothetical protein